MGGNVQTDVTGILNCSTLADGLRRFLAVGFPLAGPGIPSGTNANQVRVRTAPGGSPRLVLVIADDPALLIARVQNGLAALPG